MVQKKVSATKKASEKSSAAPIKKSDAALEKMRTAVAKSPSYRKAYEDPDFIMSDAARQIRLTTEYMKPEIALRQHKIVSTIIAFGSARILPKDKAEELLKKAEKNLKKSPKSSAAQKEAAYAKHQVEMSGYYEDARRFAELISKMDRVVRYQSGQGEEIREYVICTGGGPGIMEAANRGAYEAGAPTIGLNITLPHEQKPNPYITPELCFQFHYFAMRKLHFLLRATALVAFPGGFGTFDELFECLTLMQTGKMQRIPIVLYGEKFWRKCVNFDYLIEMGVISPEDMDLLHFVDTPEAAIDAIFDYYQERITHGL